ncbi:MAG: SusD/RagB family nutrient-binding outer membrane lipoprotein [Lewinellaceae bacterium]|nr:SusD/RagB family nutrient-binding outer membrane lipoprotein [Saprospiraceae bacterium]MCB9317588.1 SusD/RagB family nutrient-binding outer membrane lipoprotein [Lewinellaceae bacterium]MCB9334035.1 SusD/RagB family nutrient-binding outer membrane lipoprotein [Lewinellaceae bacterium]
MKKILFLLFLVGFTFSCTKDFESLNTDQKNPSNVPPGTLFSFAQKSMQDLMTEPNVNRNIFRFLSQYWTSTTYVDEPQYDISTRNIPQNVWRILYRDVLNNMKECQRLIPEQGAGVIPVVQKNQNACAEIMTVYTYSVLVLTFGDVPYSEALSYPNLYPKFDDAKTIYTDLATRLDKAISDIDVNNGGFGSQDLLYAGDMAGWKTFANSLKLRLGMILADADAGTAKRMVEEAAPGAIKANGENAVFYYMSSPPNTNPIWVDLVQSGRKDFVAANTIVDAMNGLNDPRVPLYFTEDANGGYTGGIYGTSNNYATYSKPAEIITEPDFEALLIDYAEVEFLLAEAVERNMNVGGTAAEHYEKAIRASIQYWGGSTADADTYLGQASVAYATATGDWKQKIGTQKWIALYNRGFDGWVEWRRFDYPILNVPPDPSITYADIPRRYTYPVDEQNLNTDNYNAASTAIGGDNVKTKLFWDKF